MVGLNESTLDKFIGVQVMQLNSTKFVKQSAYVREDGLALVSEGLTYVGFPYVQIKDGAITYHTGAVPRRGIKPVPVICDDKIIDLIDYADFIELTESKLSLEGLEAVMHGKNN